VVARALNYGLTAALFYRMRRLSWADVVRRCLNVGGGVVDGDITASNSALAINFHSICESWCSAPLSPSLSTLRRLSCKLSGVFGLS